MPNHDSRSQKTFFTQALDDARGVPGRLDLNGAQLALLVRAIQESIISDSKTRWVPDGFDEDLIAAGLRIDALGCFAPPIRVEISKGWARVGGTPEPRPQATLPTTQP